MFWKMRAIWASVLSIMVVASACHGAAILPSHQRDYDGQAFSPDDEAILVLDATTPSEWPKNYRRTDSLAEDLHMVDLTGLEELRAIGSGAPSQRQMLSVLDTIDGPVYLVDLRMEAHGMVNGLAVSWYAPHNWSYRELSPLEILKDEQMRLEAVRNSWAVDIHHITEKTDGVIEELIPVWTPVFSAESEDRFARRMGMGYQRFFVADHCPPSDQELDLFVEFAKEIPEGSWLYFHCRAGMGRTTTFMAVYDILKNGRRVEFADIIQRQFLLGGKDMFVLPDEGCWKYELAVERLSLLLQFYDYVNNSDADFSVPWSVWHAQQDGSTA